jgi:branched-chain amino acid transport system substrate-binding protein
MPRRSLPIPWAVLLILGTLAARADQAPLHLYLDADRTGTRAAGIAIEQGIRTALSEVDNQLDGRPVELVIRDHRGSSPRSRANLEEFLRDPQALAVFSGLHSPPLLAHRDFINDNAILLLDPWAAAGPITRPPHGENWIFRLSVDDSKAGRMIADHAVRLEGFRNPFLLLENTGWGRSNQSTMTAALSELGVEPAGLLWFNWGLGEHEARILLRRITASGADVVFLVANAPEGKQLARAMAGLPAEQRLPIRSHWGITGGDFTVTVDAAARAGLDLAFIQSRFSFMDESDRPLVHRVLRLARSLFPGQIDRPADIHAPTGFVHAYDLTRLLIAAAAQARLSGDPKVDRPQLRAALESLRQPVEGLIKTYHRPFSSYDSAHPDAHEALDSSDWTLGRYAADGTIRLEPVRDAD